MRTKTQQELIDIIRFEIRGIPLPDGFSVSEEGALIDLAKKHDLTHLVYDALTKNGISCVSSFAMQQYYASIWRAEQMMHELESMTDLFEEANIDFIPLKGAVMRPLYPEAWMRTSADIDILVRESEFGLACEMLEKKLSYVEESEKSVHHISFRSPSNNVHVEVHRTLLTEYQTELQVIDQLSPVWEQVYPRSGHKHFLYMADPYFYLYHIAHMAKHLTGSGGCPIRSLIDLWLLDTFPEQNEPGRNDILTKAGLLTFAQMMSSTAKAWLEGDSVPSEELEQFILAGEIYGSTKKRISLGIKTNGFLPFIFNRLFLPYDVLKYSYPILQKHKWLTPIFQAVRWAKVFKKKYRGWLKNRFKTYLQVNRNEMDQLDHIKQVLGIEDSKRI